MKKIFFVLFLVLGLGGCSASLKEKADERGGSGNIVYCQDTTTGVCFVASGTHNWHVVLSPIPTDQIDSVKHKITNYVEPEFLKRYKSREDWVENKR
jgi:hypothetical protein